MGKTMAIFNQKGGVGKTTITVGLAQALASQGLRVGILDTDLHGPNVAKMLNINLANRFHQGPDGLLKPVEARPNLYIAGVDSAMEDHQDAIIWRGPMKAMVINDLLAKVDWGNLDYLLIDSPPGSGDEQITVCKSIFELTGAIVVTTAQEVAILDAVRSVTFCRKMGVAILGLVENMSALVCPHCHSPIAIFGTDKGKALAKKTDIPFLGSVPMVLHDEDGRGNFDDVAVALKNIAAFLIDNITCTDSVYDDKKR